METFWRMLKWFCLSLPLFLSSFLIFFWLDSQIFWMLRYSGWILFVCYLGVSLYCLYRYMPRIDALFLRILIRKRWLIFCFLLGMFILADVAYHFLMLDALFLVVVSAVCVVSYSFITALVMDFALYKAGKEASGVSRELQS